MKRALASFVSLATLLACSSSAPVEHVGESKEAIVFGQDSDASQDAVVLIMHYDALSLGTEAGCSGVLLAPRLVLTARHCVADTDDAAACRGDGTAIAGGEVKGDYDATKLFVFGGPKRPDFISGLGSAARGAEIIDDGAKTLCNHDFALVLLATPLPGAKIAPIRLDGPARADEKFTAVGWGVTDKTNDPATRQTRSGIGVVAVGPSDELGSAEVMLGEGACSGDSGGPAFASTGAVVAVVSRGGKAGGEVPASCEDTENVYTMPALYKDVILGAYAKAGQEPWLEGQPDPTLAAADAGAGGSSGDDGGGGGGGCAIASSAAIASSGVRQGDASALLPFAAALIACLRRRRARS